MAYYHIELSPGSKQLCTIELPWGKYEYPKIHMGVCNIPDIFQENISEPFYGFDMVRAYIDDELVIAKQSRGPSKGLIYGSTNICGSGIESK